MFGNYGSEFMELVSVLLLIDTLNTVIINKLLTLTYREQFLVVEM